MSQDSPSIVNAVAISVRSGDFLPQDKALIAVVRRYADLMDQARANADEFEEIEIPTPSAAMFRRLERLEARVNVTTVAADLGPKLLAALEALGLTPAARLKITKGGAPDDGRSKRVDAADALRAEADELAKRRRASGRSTGTS